MLLALAAVLLGIVNGLAQLMDDGRTHVVCPEHGDMVELEGGAVAADRGTGPELGTATPGAHHEACVLCSFTHVGTVATLPVHASQFDLPAPEPAVGAILAAAPSRGPPGLLLANAPKTDPPRA